MRIRHRNRLEKVPGQMPEKLLLFLLMSVPAAGSLCLGLGLWMLVSNVAYSIWMILLGAVVLVLGWTDIQASMAEYTFGPDGVAVKYPLQKQLQYSWNDFQQVCVCYFSRAAEMYGYSVICLVKRGEKPDPFGRWKTSNPFHGRSILCLDYSEEQLAVIRSCCPYEIPDLRDRGNYRL